MEKGGTRSGCVRPGRLSRARRPAAQPRGNPCISSLAIRNARLRAPRPRPHLSARPVWIPPVKEKRLAFQFKPGGWAMARVRQWLDASPVVGEVEVQDIVPGRTRCLLEKAKPSALGRRMGRHRLLPSSGATTMPGWISFAQTGLSSGLGGRFVRRGVSARGRRYSDPAEVPCRFTLSGCRVEPVSAGAGPRLQVQRWRGAALAAARARRPSPPTTGKHARITHRPGGTEATSARGPHRPRASPLDRGPGCVLPPMGQRTVQRGCTGRGESRAAQNTFCWMPRGRKPRFS